MANRWISFSNAVEMIQDYYDRGVEELPERLNNKSYTKEFEELFLEAGITIDESLAQKFKEALLEHGIVDDENTVKTKIREVLPEIVINKSCIQRFENLLSEVLEYDLMDDENTIKDKNRREHFYKLTFISEEKTKFLKKIRKAITGESLNYIADYIFVNSEMLDAIKNVISTYKIIGHVKSNPNQKHNMEDLKERFPDFHTNEYLDGGYYNDLYEFIEISMPSTGYLKEIVDQTFLLGSLELKKQKDEVNDKLYQVAEKGDVSGLLRDYSSAINNFYVDNFHVNYNINTSKFSFEEAVLILLNLKILTLTMNILLTKQYEHYSIFSKIPLLSSEERRSVSDIVRMTTTFSDQKELNNNIRKFQRKVQKDYELFVKKLSKKIEVITIKHLKYYFLQLIILSEEIKEDDDNLDYIDIVKETKKIIYKMINDEHLTYKEWDYILSFVIYKEIEYHLKDETLDFMKIKIIEQSKVNSRIINILVEIFEKEIPKMQLYEKED